MRRKTEVSPELNALLTKLNALPNCWRNHASGDGSALYREGFECCATELETVLEDLSRVLGAGTLPYIKCLHCRLRSYHPKDIAERYCGQCHIFHDNQDERVTYELGADT